MVAVLDLPQFLAWNEAGARARANRSLFAALMTGRSAGGIALKCNGIAGVVAIILGEPSRRISRRLAVWPFRMNQFMSIRGIPGVPCGWSAFLAPGICCQGFDEKTVIPLTPDGGATGSRSKHSVPWLYARQKVLIAIYEGLRISFHCGSFVFDRANDVFRMLLLRDRSRVY